MKKYLALVLAVAMVMALAACGGSAPAAKPAAKVKITLATGGTSGTYYAVGGAMPSVLGSKLKLSEITEDQVDLFNLVLLDMRDMMNDAVVLIY